MKGSLFKKTKQVLLLTLFTLLPICAVAQPANDSTAKIVGKVQCRYDKNPERDPINVHNAEVILYYQKEGKVDSLLRTTDSNGNFYFNNIKPPRVGLKIHCTGYETASGVFEVEAGDNVFYFTLKRQIKTLDAAKVVAEIPLIKQIQDTTIYNTTAVKTTYDESLRGVLDRLPGFKLSDDGITVNGEKVKRTYVNGTLVFGDRVTSAVDALKAEEVTQVKVYDELPAEARHRGDKNGRKIRVLDIITKEKILKMDIASAAVAGGADFTPQSRYAIGAGAIHHSEQLETAVVANTNNINISNDDSTPEFLAGKADKLVSQTEPLDSYKEATTINLLLNRYWKSRDWGNSVSFHYKFDNVYSRSAATAIKEYFEGEITPSQTLLDTLTSRAVNKHHTGEVFLNLRDTPLKSIFGRIYGIVSDNKNNNFYGNLTSIDGIGETRVHQNQGGAAKDYKTGFNFSWSNMDNVEWCPSIGIHGGISNNSTTSWNVDTLETSYLRRKLNADGVGRGITGHIFGNLRHRITNTEQRTSNILFQIRTEYEYSKQKQLSLDSFGQSEPQTDIANSFDYTRNQWKTEACASYDINVNTLGDFSCYCILQHTALLDTERMPSQFVKKKNFWSLQSGLSYTGKGVLLFLNTYPIIPAIEQISNRISDSNPLSLMAGNPNLKQGYKADISVQYRSRPKKFKDGSSGNIDASLKGSFSLRPIVSSVVYFSKETVLGQWDGYVAQPGSMLHTFDNSKIPSWNINAVLGYSGLMFHNKFRYNVSLIDNYLHGPISYGEEIVPIDDNAVGVSARLSFTPSKALSLSNNVSVNHTSSLRNGEKLTSRMRLNEMFQINWFMTKQLKLNTEYKYIGNNYISGIGLNHYQHILNAGLDMIMLKDRSLTISAVGYDLLNSGSNYTTEINAAMMSQTWTPTYGRNLMLKIVYTLRSK